MFEKTYLLQHEQPSVRQRSRYYITIYALCLLRVELNKACPICYLAATKVRDPCNENIQQPTVSKFTTGATFFFSSSESTLDVSQKAEKGVLKELLLNIQGSNTSPMDSLRGFPCSSVMSCPRSSLWRINKSYLKENVDQDHTKTSLCSLNTLD